MQPHSIAVIEALGRGDYDTRGPHARLKISIVKSSHATQDNPEMPRYLIPVAKPFAPVLNLGEDLHFGSYYSPITRKSKLELTERSGSNTGNFAFILSVIKQLGADSVAHQADVESTDPGFIREHFDRVVVPSSNFIASKSSGFLEGALVSKLKEWGLPFVIVGLGTQLNADQHIS